MAEKTSKIASNDVILYTKGQLLSFNKYKEIRDILSVVLVDDKKYSIQETEELVKKFKESKVR
ncbi:MAG: hypothetical protein J6Y29_02910 [Clostridiales bacterium]|nr:hypothetical protein [Clostridiales bacterium]